jgi:hypothetical protein
LSPFRDFGQIDGPSLTKELSAALKRSRTRLAASLTDVLIFLSPDEKAGRRGGRAAMKLTLAEKGVAVSLA